MKRIFLIISIIYVLISNVSCAETLKSEDSSANYADNIEQAQDQEEFYQMDEVELKEMGYETIPKQNSSAQENSNKENEADSVSLDTKTDSMSIPPASDKLFIIGVEKTEEKNEIGADNMFWYDSNNFRNTYYQNEKNTSPMPIMFNNSYVSNKMGKNTMVYVGQNSLGAFKDQSVGFIRANETTYDNGAKIITGTDKVNFTAGIYDSTLNHNLSGGAALSSKPIRLKKVKGSFVFGGGYYTNELDYDNKNTAGIFGQYRLQRFKLTLQAAKSKYSDSNGLENSLYFTPEYQLTDSLSIRTRFVKNIAQNVDQNEIGLSYKPKKYNPRDFELEFNAANTYEYDQAGKPKFRFFARFKV